MTRQSSPLTLDVFNWLARLPFLASDDLALLTGQPEPEVETVLRALERGGHIEWVTPSSPGLDTSRLYVLTELARQHVAGEAGGGCAFPGERRDILHRLPCLEATVALNAFAAGLVASQRRGVEVGDFLSLPVARHSDAWWPPGVRAFGCLQSDAIAAPFFVVVGRAGAPNAHRSALVAGWYQFRESRQPWGRDGVPPILILCPGPAQADAWARGVLSSADRRCVAPLDVLLAERSAFLDADAIWRRADRGATGVLAQLLTWLPGPAPWAATGPVALPPPAEAGHPRLQAWAQATLRKDHEVSTLERLAALALATTATEKQLLDCLGRHPLLTAAELAVVLGVEPRFVRLAVERSLRHGLIAEAGRSRSGEPLYCLAATALWLLAAGDQVPVRRYAKHTSITAVPADGRGPLPTLLQQREHTLGVNSFFVGWLHKEAPGGPRLCSWLSAAESALRFEVRGQRRWLRPDGTGNVISGGRRFPFLLEWDRGTERLPVIAFKLARYAEYSQARRAAGQGSPALLFVTTTPQREELVRRIGMATVGQCSDHLMTTTASLLERLGPFGAVWRSRAQEHRTRWPGSVNEHDHSREVPR